MIKGMRSIAILALLFVFPLITSAQYTKAEKDVVDLLERQAEDWNAGDLKAFMDGYLNSIDLVFIGSNGVTYGWETVFNNYQNNYPNDAARGMLKFELKQVRQHSRKVVSVVGKFILERKDEVLDGHFLLLVKKIKSRWKIVADHTS